MILVTGGTGLAGSQLVFDLITAGETVRVLKRNSGSLHNLIRLFGKTLPSNLSFYEGDVTDGFSVEEAMEGVDAIYHTAAFVSFNKADRDMMMKVNVDGTATMVNLALKLNIKRFCHYSSVAAIGRVSGDVFIDENAEWKNSEENSNYAISKFRGEREVWRAMEEGLSAFIINPSIIIGPGDWKSGSSQMFTQVSKGLPYYTDGSSGFVDVRDVSKCAIELMKRGVSGQRYIINGDNVSYRYVFDLIAENFGKKKSHIHISPFIIEVAWRFEALRSKLLRYKPMITKETARNGLMHWNYLNDKIVKEIGVEFAPVKKSGGYGAIFPEGKLRIKAR